MTKRMKKVAPVKPTPITEWACEEYARSLVVRGLASPRILDPGLSSGTLRTIRERAEFANR